MDKPEHLRRFPCMCPWIGRKYKSSERRLAIVAESHYLKPWPQDVTPLNYDPEKWYAARQEDVPNKTAQSWMNTDWCVRNLSESHNRTYLKIDKVLKRHRLSFDDIAFFNYVSARRRKINRDTRRGSCSRFSKRTARSPARSWSGSSGSIGRRR